MPPSGGRPMQLLIAAAAAAVATTTTTTSSSSPPPRWGGGNASAGASSGWQALVRVADVTAGAGGASWFFRYYADAGCGVSGASRFEHFVGEHVEACHLPGRDARGPCTVLSAEDERLYVSWAAFGRHPAICCHCGRGSAPEAPDWFTGLGGVYRGRALVDGAEADEWVRYGQADDHYFVSVDSRQAPLRFVENKRGRMYRWDFQQWVPEIPWSGIFARPLGCGGDCPPDLCSIASDEVLL